MISSNDIIYQPTARSQTSGDVPVYPLDLRTTLSQGHVGYYAVLVAKGKLPNLLLRTDDRVSPLGRPALIVGMSEKAV